MAIAADAHKHRASSIPAAANQTFTAATEQVGPEVPQTGLQSTGPQPDATGRQALPNLSVDRIREGQKPTGFEIQMLHKDPKRRETKLVR